MLSHAQPLTRVSSSSNSSSPSNTTNIQSSGHTNSSSATSTNYKLAVAGSDQISVFNFSLADASLTRHISINPHPKPINDVKWNHNNHVLVSCSDDGYLVMTTLNGENIGKLPLEEQVLSISIGEFSRKLCTGGALGIVKIWDLKKKEVIQTFKGHKGGITLVALSEGDQYIASADANGIILVHNLQMNTLSCTLTNNSQQAVKSMEFSSFHKSLLATAGDDGSVIVWDIHSGKPYCSFMKQHQAPCTGVHFSKQNAALLASAGLDKCIYFFDIKEKRMVETIKTSHPISSFSYMDNGSIIAIGTSNGLVFIYDLKKSTSTPVAEVAIGSFSIKSMAFQAKLKKSSTTSSSSDNSKLATTLTRNQSTERMQEKQHTPPAEIIPQRPTTPTHPPKSTLSMDSQAGMDVFSPVKNMGDSKMAQLFPTVEDIKKQAQLEHLNAKISSNKMVGDNPFKSKQPTFKPIEQSHTTSKLDSSINLGHASNNRMSLYKSLKPSQDDRALLSPSGPKKKQKYDISSPCGDDTNDDFNSDESIAPPILHQEDFEKKLTNRPQIDRMMDENEASENISSQKPSQQASSPLVSSNNTPKIGSSFSISKNTGVSEDSIRDIVKESIQDSLFVLQTSLHQDITNMHVDILRQFCLQQEQNYSLIEQLSKQVQSLKEEVRMLREENSQLKNLI
ncbi:hypothetical protein C9374_001748 [Naegleria lovaniensis]|uniref:E3 ubiquitin-protein ligase RFWD3-like WD40 domain-containing protein n=1 Tax=Naegleria lovaniensis TaxID=51637 RepID=A0AA88KNB9_NAELO|nr:uncharacterized protein C9374_001748 [Naegleria lovaniensis]KAG2387416.1 hypothetical protein C9374_001748 [Naegleria lovaniensis]